MGFPSSSASVSSHFLADKDIIVIGGGVAGPAFALALRQQWPESLAQSRPRIKIFERDSHEDRVGREGYTLSLRNDGMSGGVQTLDKLGLYEKVVEVSVTGGGEGKAGANRGSFCIWDRHWKPLLKLPPKAVGPKGLRSMRVRRNALQSVLVRAVLESGTPIVWGKRCLNVEQLETGMVKVVFDDGSEEQANLVVTADGANSKILTSLRPENRLNFTGAVCLSGTSRFESPKHVPKPVDKDWGLVLVGNGIGLFASPVDELSALWSLSYLAREPRERLQHPLTPEQVHSILDEARRLGSAIPEPFLKLVENSDGSTLMVVNAMDRKAFSHDPDNPRHGNVVFLGDANHAVRYV